MQHIAARLRDDADLAARACTELGRVVARFDAKFLNRLEARLETKTARDLPIQIARRCVEDRSGFHAIDADCVLLIGPAAETDIIERTAAPGLGARSQQVELRNLASVQWQVPHFALIHVRAD